jgi:hypothetical protein
MYNLDTANVLNNKLRRKLKNGFKSRYVFTDFNFSLLSTIFKYMNTFSVGTVPEIYTYSRFCLEPRLKQDGTVSLF